MNDNTGPIIDWIRAIAEMLREFFDLLKMWAKSLPEMVSTAVSDVRWELRGCALGLVLLIIAHGLLARRK